jgi:hypothetical protein
MLRLPLWGRGIFLFNCMTEIDIINQALNYLGEARIQSLTQNTNSAKYGLDSLHASVDQVLRLHKWNSAIKRETLVRLTEDNAFGAKYNYQLPNDFVKFVQMNEGTEAYRIEGKRIVTDENLVQLVYVAYPDDFSAIDAGLVEAIASKLAFNISIQVTGETSNQTRMLELHERFLARARTNDARESSLDDQSLYAETLRDSPMIQARRSRGSNRYRYTSGR